MNLKTKLCRILCLCLSVILLIGALASCASTSEVPEGYQYATCAGEYFRLFVPTQWTVNTESGISSAYISSTDNAAVSMVEVAFVHDAEKEATPLEQFKTSHMAELETHKGYQAEKLFDSTLSGHRAVDMTYVMTVAGRPSKDSPSGESDRRFRQVLSYVSEQGRYYLFTFSAPKDEFERWLDIVDEILENITFESFPFEGLDDRKIPTSVDVPEGMKLVSDNEVGYRFFAPESWIRDTRNGQNFVYVSEEDRSNVSMFSYDIGEDATYTVDTYWETCKEQYENTLGDFVLVSESEITLKNGDNGEKTAKVYEYTYTLGGVSYKARQMVVLVGMIYTMTYTALPEQYDLHISEVEAMEQALYFRKLGD